MARCSLKISHVAYCVSVATRMSLYILEEELILTDNGL